MDLKLDDKIRFKSFVIQKAEDDCWPFVGRLNEDNYGCFDVNYTRILAHRVAYFLATGNDPAEQLVCHSCDNPCCCNPKHLFLGTSQDNINDSVMKGRHSSVNLVGEARPNVMLTEKEVLEIRYKRSLGLTLEELAKVYKVHLSTIHQIVTRKTWRHI